MIQKQLAEMFYKKSDLNNFGKFTEIHQVGVIFLKKLKGQACNLRLQHSCFPVNFEKILRTPFMYHH